MWPLSALFRWSSDAARRRILEGNAPRRMRVQGALNLANSPSLQSLPARLSATTIDVSSCRNLRTLPCRLKCQELNLSRTNIESLPCDIEVTTSINAAGCSRLRMLSELKIDSLILRGCVALERLPETLIVRNLDVSRCRRLEYVPDITALYVVNLDVSECPSLTALPERFGRLQTLNVSGCSGLRELPAGIRIRTSIDVAGSGLRELPWSLRSVRVLWHGVPVSDRVAFAPETITVDEILTERNAAMRQVLLERVGLEWFAERAQATIIDRDHDAGGERRLLRIPFDGGDDIVCVQVKCPSTAKHYMLRVPPEMQTCQQAVAWTAGFNNPNSYRPLIET